VIGEATSESLALVPAARFFLPLAAPAHRHEHPQPETPASVASPVTTGRTGFLLVLLNGSPGRLAGHAARYQAHATASKELMIENIGPLRAAPDVLDRDAARFDPALTGLVSERLYQPIIDQEGTRHEQLC